MKVRENRVSRGRAGSKRGQQVAERSGLRIVIMRMAAVEVDELSELVDVRHRMLERRLPAGNQRERQQQPKEECAQAHRAHRPVAVSS